MEILPAIMPDSYDDLRDKLALVSDFVSTVQIDVMDGRFVPSRSWPYNLHQNDPKFEKVLHEEEGLPFWDRLNFEFDLMVENPEAEIEKYITAGASRLVIHLESIKGDVVQLLEEVRKRAVEVGLALDMKTSTDEVLPFLDHIDFVQLMGIAKIGYQGQPFDEGVVERIKELKEKAPSTVICVDGGVSMKTAPALIAAGADRLVVGSAIFASNDIESVISEFENL